MSMTDTIQILLSEQAHEVPAGTTLFGLRDQRKPDADVVILNGAPAAEDSELHTGDAVVFIQRGQTPSREELGALMASRHTPGVHAKLQQATVGIANNISSISWAFPRSAHWSTTSHESIPM